jgi:hypothetical protein
VSPRWRCGNSIGIASSIPEEAINYDASVGITTTTPCP